MKRYDVQDIELAVSSTRAFARIADPTWLPNWTEAFSSADSTTAVLNTPGGSMRIGLEVLADAKSGTIDWKMLFPDGSVGWAHSRIVPLDDARSAYTFVLHAPPAPLEAIEGALQSQRATLARELRRLKEALETA